MNTIKQKIFALILAAIMTFNFTGCTIAVAGGAIIGKAYSWLFWWKKDDPSTEGMSDETRLKEAFSAYIDVAIEAMETAKSDLAPEETADTEDIEYTQIIKDTTLDPCDFFAVWLENYQTEHPEDETFETVGELVTVENLTTFFTDNYFDYSVTTIYKGGDGTIYPTKEKAEEIAEKHTEKRGDISDKTNKISEKENKITENNTAISTKRVEIEELKTPSSEEVEVYNPDYDYYVGKYNEAVSDIAYLENLLSTTVNSNAKTSIQNSINTAKNDRNYYENLVNSTPQYIWQNKSVDNSQKISEKETEIAQLETENTTLQGEINTINAEISPAQAEIDNLKITAETSVEFFRKPDVINNLGLNSENIEAIKELLQSIKEE